MGSISNKPIPKDQRSVRAWLGAFFFVFAGLGLHSAQGGKPPVGRAPQVSDYFKPEALARVLKDREAVASARLDQPDYHFSLAVLVRASRPQVWQTVTTYGLYEKLIPMIEKSEFDAKTKRLELAGGIFGFKLRSFLKFRERTPQWLEYEVVEGHFVGMKGHLITQDAGEKGVIVALLGTHASDQWPPKFVMEEGAKIVLNLTANKMRSYIEDLKRQK
ncbi:MAG: hypothetical protein AB7F66_00850 [Bacteriovoracia bacterium]